jgi:hypothetical protein
MNQLFARSFSRVISVVERSRFEIIKHQESSQLNRQQLSLTLNQSRNCTFITSLLAGGKTFAITGEAVNHSEKFLLVFLPCFCSSTLRRRAFLRSLQVIAIRQRKRRKKN